MEPVKITGAEALEIILRSHERPCKTYDDGHRLCETGEVEGILANAKIHVPEFGPSEADSEQRVSTWMEISFAANKHFEAHKNDSL